MRICNKLLFTHHPALSNFKILLFLLRSFLILETSNTAPTGIRKTFHKYIHKNPRQILGQECIKGLIHHDEVEFIPGMQHSKISRIQHKEEKPYDYFP